VQLAEEAELRRVELGHRARDAPAEIVGQIDVDVVQIEVHRGVGAGGRHVEILRDHDDGGDPLRADRPLGVGRGQLLEQVRIGVSADDAGHPRRERPLSLYDERHRLLADRVREHRDQHAHAEGRKQRGRDRRRRPQPHREVVARHAPRGADHRVAPFARRPSVRITATTAIATSTSRST